MFPAFLKTVRHFFPLWDSWLASLPDPRDPFYIVYPVAFLTQVGLLMFLTKIGARRQIRFQFKTACFIRNTNLLCGARSEKMAHPDTLEYLLERMPPAGLEAVRSALIRHLLRSRVLEQGRLLGKYYTVAIDGSGHLVYSYPHCDHCLTQKKGGNVIYYHPVLEAKLVTPGGLALSMMTEFIENAEVGKDKQDCERQAFVRLTKRLKEEFPQLRICLLMDSLYACGPVFDRCRDYGWRFIVTFKKGSAPAVFEEYESLKAAGAKPYRRMRGAVAQEYQWVHGVDFSGHPVDILECVEQDPQKGRTRFVWATNIPVTEANYIELAGGGRRRWKIENEGFNIQKNNGYEMEHVYSEHEEAAKNFYLLLQIAHLLSQLIEKGLLAKKMKKHIGAIRNVARFLLEELRGAWWPDEELNRRLAQRIQIRLADTS